MACSLGSKLHVLLACVAGGQSAEGDVEVVKEPPPLYAGHVLVAFNNASAVDTVRARTDVIEQAVFDEAHVAWSRREREPRVRPKQPQP